MKFEDHCARCSEVLGASYDFVHLWLDAFHTPGEGMQHRALRHNAEGIAKVNERWGPGAAAAAKLHILDDLKAYLFDPDENDIPDTPEQFRALYF